MEIVRLPALPSVATVQTAFDLLKNAARTGLVTSSAQGLRLITARGLKRALDRPGMPLSEVNDFHALSVVPRPAGSDVVVSAGLVAPLGQVHRPSSDIKPDLVLAIETFVSGIGGMYAFLTFEAGAALVVTRSERGAEARGGTGPLSCSCDGEFEHEIDQPAVLPGRLCPICGAGVSCDR